MIGERVDGEPRNITAIDSDGVRELMLAFAREFDELGYPFVLEEITDAGGDIGSAVASPMSHGDVRVIAGYLKEVAGELLAEAPSEERAEALLIVQKAWDHLKTLVR